MASIEESNSAQKKTVGIKKIQRKSINIDMTPMVDLGFSLITFFIFTTTLSTPKALELVVPNETGTSVIAKHGVLTILLGKDFAYTYESDQVSQMKPISYNQIRKKILQKKQKCTQNNLEGKFMVLIKPTKESSYQQVVDLLDEMTINEVKRYALIDASKIENQISKNL